MPRAAPIPPEARRAAILATTEALIVAQGGDVSTRAIAEAAGIAEGTIFRVFPTKDAIIDAIFEDAFNREAGKAELSKVDLSLALEPRLIALVTIMQRRIRRILALFAAVGFRKPSSMQNRKDAAARDFGLAEVIAILEPDRERLRVPPKEAARLLLSMVMALSNPMLVGARETAPEEIVDLLLNGIALHSPSSKPPKGTSC